MSGLTPEEKPDRHLEDRFLDPANLGEAQAEYLKRLETLLEEDDEAGLASVAGDLEPGDLSEILRPLSIENTARVLRVLSPDLLAEVLAEIDNRSLSALFTLLDIDDIADIVEEMPSDEATDLIGELEEAQAQELLAAMEEEEREEVTELLQYPPESAGGLMGKEFAAVEQNLCCRDAIALVRTFDEDDLEEMHFVFVVDGAGHLIGRVPLVKLLLARPETPITTVMESDPHHVDVTLDQEAVAQFAQNHDLISIPVVDENELLVGRITADDLMDVMEDEATEDISRLAGMSADDVTEQSPFRVARSRLPWLLGGLVGQMGSVLVMEKFQVEISTFVRLAFFVPVIMAMAGNIGMQTSSVVVRGLATGELSLYRTGRHLGGEVLTALMTGAAVATVLFLIAFGQHTSQFDFAAVLGLAMLVVILFAALAGTGIPLLLHRLGVDPAVATGPFITTANDVCGLLIYLGLASWLL